MSIFSVIAEAKIQDWFRRKSAGELPPPETIETIDTVKSSETYLLEDILLLIERASVESTEARDLMLQKAREMEIQLLATLENDGYNLMAQMTAETIREHRKKHKSLSETADSGESGPVIPI